VRGGIRLDVAQTARLDFALEVGAVSETVEVTSQAPLLDAGSSSIGQVVDAGKIVNLPTNGRNSHGFITLVPGVRAPRNFSRTAIDQYNNMFVSINGARPNQNTFYLDGGNNSTSNFNGPSYTPSVDIVEEFKVQTNNYSAEFANAAGGVVNLVTRAGTNQIHGTLYEFFRNDKLTATDFFLNRAGFKKAPFRFNQFGATTGGPLRKNRTFFFLAYEGLRNVQGMTWNGTLPTAAQKQGDFTETRTANGQAIVMYDPVSTVADPAAAGRFIRTPFAGNRIPAARIDRVTRNYLPFFPQPTIAGDPVTGNNNFVSNASAPTNKDDGSARVDHGFSDKLRFFARHSYGRTPQGRPNVYGNQGTVGTGNDLLTSRQIIASATYGFTPTFFGEFSSAFNRYTLDRQGYGVGFNPTDLGFPAYLAANSMRLAFPTISIEGMTVGANVGNQGSGTLGGSLIANHGYDRFEERANFTRIFGRHTWKFGGLFGVARQNNDNPLNAGGAFNFNRAFTQGPDPLRASPAGGLGFASFLLGVGGGSHNTTRVGMAVVNNYWGGYFQDDFKVSGKLTLNFGVRYDYAGPFRERYNHLVNLDSTSAGTAQGGVAVRGGLRFPATGGLPRGAWDPDRNNVSPRFGFAFNLNPATVVRGGYGVFFAQMNGGGYNSNVIPNTGFNCVTEFTGTVDGGLTPFNYLSDPFPGGFCLASRTRLGLATSLGENVFYTDRGARTPYSQQWNFDIQRLLPGGLVLEAAYAATRGIKLLGALEDNQIPLESLALGSQLLTRVPNPFQPAVRSGPLSTPTTTRNQLLRPYPQYLVVNSSAATYGSSIYHALQAKVEKRMARGFSFLASYTLSKIIDDAGATTTGFPGEPVSGGGIQNHRNRRGERALAVFDVPHNLMMSSLWELPFRPGGVARHVVAGWQINGIATFRSGVPLGITGGNASQAFGGTQRPNWSGQDATLTGQKSGRLQRYFDTAAFSFNDPFSFGNSPRLLPNLRGAGIHSMDLSVFKHFQIRESMRLQFRAEFFNFTNTPEFGLPNTAFGSPLFGVVGTQENFARDVQFALKLLF